MRHGLILAMATVVGLVGCKRAAESPVATPPPAPAAPVATAAVVHVTEPPSVEPILQQARELQQAGKLAEARALLQSLAEANDVPEDVLTLLGAVHTEILFSRLPAPEKVEHIVAAGDTLGALAQHYGTTIELIRRAHGLKSDVIRVGDRLRIWHRPFAVQVHTAANTLTVLCDGKFFKRYRIGTGERNQTPLGEYRIISRIAQPPWWREGEVIPYGDPRNILGTHWLGLDAPGYGIHGTWDTNSVGRASTAGCIRLYNEDVEELFTMLPVGTTVSIQE